MFKLKKQKLHINEPQLLKLKMLRKRLYSEESTSENLKKIEALEVQIAWHEKLKLED